MLWCEELTWHKHICLDSHLWECHSAEPQHWGQRSPSQSQSQNTPSCCCSTQMVLDWQSYKKIIRKWGLHVSYYFFTIPEDWEVTRASGRIHWRACGRISCRVSERTSWRRNWWPKMVLYLDYLSSAAYQYICMIILYGFMSNLVNHLPDCCGMCNWVKACWALPLSGISRLSWWKSWRRHSVRVECWGPNVSDQCRTLSCLPCRPPDIDILRRTTRYSASKNVPTSPFSL